MNISIKRAVEEKLHDIKILKENIMLLLKKGDVEDFNKYIFFIGTPRSGHTFVAKAIETHKNILITNEINYFWIKRILNLSNETMKKLLFKEYKRKEKYQKEVIAAGTYNFKIENTFQGKIEKCIFVGDKKAAGTTFELKRNIKIFEKLDKDFVIFNVIRNPFDNITTIAIKGMKNKKAKLNKKHIKRAVKMYFDMIKTTEAAINYYGEKIVTIKHEDIINNTREELIKIYTKLNLEINEEEIKEIEKITFKEPNKSRYNYQWSIEEIEEVESEMKKYKTLYFYDFKN